MLVDELKALQLDGDIADDQVTLEKYSRDASLYEIKPQVVVFPKNVEDIKKLVSFCARAKERGENISLSPRAAGTDMTGGPLSDSIVLEFCRYFNAIEEVADGYAVTQPGVYYRDFERETLKNGLIFPVFPASRDLCALGGMVANNCAGEKTLTYGKMEDFVLELNMVLEDGQEYTFKALNAEELDAKCLQQNFEGEVYRKLSALFKKNLEMIKAAKPKVHKNSAGYYLWNVDSNGMFDLNKIIVGSQGTLGIITKMKIRLVPVNNHSKLLVIFLNNLKNLAQIINTVLKYKPETFESFDDNTLKIALKFLPELFKHMKTRNIFSLAFRFLPEAWMALTGGIPKMILMAELAGNDEREIDAKLSALHKELQPTGVRMHLTRTEQEAEKYWVMRHESFNLLRNHVHGMRTAPFIDDITVRPEYLPEFLPRLEEIINHYNLIYTIAGHVGDGNFHIIPLMDFNKPETAKIIPELSEKVFKLVLNYQGSITAEHNDGLVRGPYLKMMYGSKIYELFRELKRIFDPLDIFNPHKKAEADLAYSMAHIVTKS